MYYINMLMTHFLFSRVECQERIFTMGTKDKTKDENRFLNIRLSSETYDKFEAFCKKYGMSKTGAVEAAILRYIELIDGKFIK